jgi:hypothetical protein
MILLRCVIGHATGVVPLLRYGESERLSGRDVSGKCTASAEGLRGVDRDLEH